MRTEQQYRDEFRSKLLELIVQISKSEDGRTAMVQSGEIIDELLTVIALLGYGSSAVSTPSKMRDKCVELARTIQRRMSGLQRRAAKGELDFFTNYNFDSEQ